MNELDDDLVIDCESHCCDNSEQKPIGVDVTLDSLRLLNILLLTSDKNLKNNSVIEILLNKNSTDLKKNVNLLSQKTIGELKKYKSNDKSELYYGELFRMLTYSNLIDYKILLLQ